MLKAWWGKHWETATIALCALSGLAVMALMAWEAVVDMNGLP